MLQQTRVAAVVDRYTMFVEQFPSVAALAQAPEDDVLALWSGLGYYRRARMLHKAAKFVTEHRQGKLPATSAELKSLPGIGAYTAAAIASIAFGEPVPVVDGNVERVLCRLAGWEAGPRKSAAALKRDVEALAAELLDPAQPGEFNQAMMELGALVCTPRSPNCKECPIAAACQTRGEHRRPARPRMLSREVAHALSIRMARSIPTLHREVLLEQRPASHTVMPGLWELPLLRETTVPEVELRMAVRHAIMQVNYYVRVRSVLENDVPALTIEGGERRWVPLMELDTLPLTGLTRKVLTRAHLLVSADAKGVTDKGRSRNSKR